MKVKVSNTGKGITLSFAKADVSFERVQLSYNVRCIRIMPSEEGNKLSSSSPASTALSIQSSRFPSWPLHGLIELEFQLYGDKDQVQYYEAVLPEKLPPAKPINRKKALDSLNQQGENNWQEASKTVRISAGIGTGNVVVTILGKPHHCQVPDADLLSVMLEWAKKGYLL